ncbi:MAG: hypothetical protein V7L29_26295 [Nostoc sp.]
MVSRLEATGVIGHWAIINSFSSCASSASPAPSFRQSPSTLNS